MLSLSKWLVLTALCSLALIGCVSDPGNTSGRVVVHDDHGMVDIAFSDHDREIIRDYYGYNRKIESQKNASGSCKKRKVATGIAEATSQTWSTPSRSSI